MITFTKLLKELKQTPQRLSKSLNAVISQDGKKMYERIKIGFEIEGYFCIHYNSSMFQKLANKPLPEVYRQLLTTLEGQPKIKNYLEAIFDVAKKIKGKPKKIVTSFDFAEHEKALKSLIEMTRSFKQLFEHLDWSLMEKELKPFNNIKNFVFICRTLYEEMKDVPKDEEKKVLFLKQQMKHVESLAQSNLLLTFETEKNLTSKTFRQEGKQKMREYSDGAFPDIYFSLIADELKENISSETKVVFSSQYQGQRNNQTAIRVEYDSSLDQELSIFEREKTAFLVVPVEIITPPMSLNSPDIESSEPMKLFKNILNFLNKEEEGSPIFVTAESSGLHFNISGYEYPNASTTSIDWLMFFVYLESGETGVLKLFDREQNSFSKSQLSNFKEFSGVEGTKLFFVGNNNKKIDRNSLISFSEKYYSGNLSKQYAGTKIKPISAPLEIRGMGNSNYHLDENYFKIKLTIQKVIYALMLSSSRKEVMSALGVSKKDIEKDRLKRMSKVLNPIHANFLSDDLFSLRGSKSVLTQFIRKKFLKCVEVLQIKTIGNRFAKIEEQDSETLLLSLKEIKEKRTLTAEDVHTIFIPKLKQVSGSIFEILKDVQRISNDSNLGKEEISKIYYFVGPTFSKIVKKKLQDLNTKTILKMLSNDEVKRMKADDGIEFDDYLIDFLIRGEMNVLIEDVLNALKLIEKFVTLLTQRKNAT